uniref:Uncharacterized protein n=1 Tax=Heterorhabditis bacteriophora TaxID=37862 RepID=A0A1I7X1N9_HETBA
MILSCIICANSLKDGRSEPSAPLQAGCPTAPPQSLKEVDIVDTGMEFILLLVLVP